MCVALTLDQKWLEIVLEMTREQLRTLNDFETRRQQQTPDSDAWQLLIVDDSMILTSIAHSVQNSTMEKLSLVVSSSSSGQQEQQEESGTRREGEKKKKNKSICSGKKKIIF